jgi:hypothetical protein
VTINSQIIYEAQKWLNVSEQGHNDGPEVRQWLKRVNRAPGNAWCAAFCWSMLDDACKALGIKNIFPPIAGAWLMLNQAKKMKAWTDIPGQGFIFGIDHGKNAAGARIGHVGIVTSVTEGKPDEIQTAEGNTSVGGSREGDGVYARTRKLSEVTLGYFDPGVILVQ